MGEPGLGAHGTVGDVAPTPIHLGDGGRLESVDPGPRAGESAQQVLQLGIIERARLDAAQLVEEVFHSANQSIAGRTKGAQAPVRP